MPINVEAVLVAARFYVKFYQLNRVSEYPEVNRPGFSGDFKS
jgi:hypothetical protein